MKHDVPRSPVLETGMKNPSPTADSSRRICRRMWLIAVPGLLVLIFVMASIPYLHPSAHGMLLSLPDSKIWQERSSQEHLWWHHEREQRLGRRQVSTSPAVMTPIMSSTSSSTSNSPVATPASTTTTADSPVPTIPSSPPILPTPFVPLPKDVTRNFSEASCFNFIANMTAAPSFLSCRPLSYLVDQIEDFVNAQTNLTLMNSYIWGTCNTNTTEAQCIANMESFSESLQKSCVQDLQHQNEMAVSFLRDLQTYSLMRDAGCLINHASNTYCYLDAVNHDNLDFYSLPFGLSVPNTAKPLCTACTRDLLSLYSSELANSTEASALTGLQQTYENAAKLAVERCGTAYANTTLANAVPATPFPDKWTGLAVLLLGVMLQTLSCMM